MTCKAIRVFAHPFSLYGAEVAEPAQELLGKYQTAVANTVGKQKGHRSVDPIFGIYSAGRDLDPCVQIFVMRAVMMRRFIDQHPDNLQLVQNILRNYAARTGDDTVEGTDVSADSLRERHSLHLDRIFTK